ncbi:energy coupling factor transporter S component ThiW [Tissierella pigra]|uniref:Energy coupling factor transporter S component ThiW n=1 Tax=Tissierella pigra TaxID=2607614 RepID=A0A6N7Y238_9FIRM|nr:energy coupling factor transporter S component ThiW [Tissierella pigra]MBU5425033.1 energy coupling factor transporter S component ThiW [Tissierella pigra]MSU02538.1 energy coupling factor transporter S component ThiW [Tissierella pigra]
MNLRKLTLSSLLIGIGVVSSNIIYIPLGIAKVFPVQHVINVIMAVLFGPWYGIAVAFLISLIRNLLGTGSLLAFPGSMIGAFLAGILYRNTNKSIYAIIGEVVGTGIIGAVVSYSIAKYFLGKESTLIFFVGPFILSSLVGGISGYFLLKLIAKTNVLKVYITNIDDLK